MHKIVKLILTLILILWVMLPFFEGTVNSSLVSDVLSIGIYGSLSIVSGFFILVAFYCRTLQKCFTLIRPSNRKARPSSVWYMFALPFNFIEDFFIVINLSNSLEAEKKTNVKLKDLNDFGMVSGIGWSIAQLLSLIPDITGYIASLAGMILLVFHWVLIAKVNKLLLQN